MVATWATGAANMNKRMLAAATTGLTATRGSDCPSRDQHYCWAYSDHLLIIF
jgi:hypothetical protein